MSHGPPHQRRATETLQNSARGNSGAVLLSARHNESAEKGSGSRPRRRSCCPIQRRPSNSNLRMARRCSKSHIGHHATDPMHGPDLGRASLGQGHRSPACRLPVCRDHDGCVLPPGMPVAHGRCGETCASSAASSRRKGRGSAPASAVTRRVSEPPSPTLPCKLPASRSRRPRPCLRLRAWPRGRAIRASIFFACSATTPASRPAATRKACGRGASRPRWQRALGWQMPLPAQATVPKAAVYEKVGNLLGMTPGAARRGGKGGNHPHRFRHLRLRPPAGRRNRARCVLPGIRGTGRCVDGRPAAPFPERHHRVRRPGLGQDRCAGARLPPGAEARSRPCPLDLRGTAFQQRVWRALCEIPSGETRTYAQVAAMIGNPAAVRAVARSCATNPVSLAVPCHRVVGSNGDLTGYRWGVPRKHALLHGEGALPERTSVMKAATTARRS